MKKLIMLTAVIILLGSVTLNRPAMAGSTSPYGPEGDRFGLGIILGEPSGLSAKGYFSPRVAGDLIVSWSFVHDALIIVGDVLYDFVDIPVNTRSFTLPFYAGVGGMIGFIEKGNDDGKTFVGVRVPVGVAMQFTNYPIEVFFEVAPGIELAPSTDPDVTGGIGARFFF